MKPSLGGHVLIASSGEAMQLTVTETGATSTMGTFAWDGNVLVHTKLNLTLTFTSPPNEFTAIVGNPAQVIVGTWT